MDDIQRLLVSSRGTINHSQLAQDLGLVRFDLECLQEYLDSLLIFTLVLSLLMVSRIPLMSLKMSHFRFRGNEGRYILLVMVGVAFIFSGLNAAPLLVPIYIIASIISLLFK